MPRKTTIKTRTITIDDQLHPYTLRRSRRARHILLHVDHDGSIEVVVPWYVAFKAAEAFVQERTSWLTRQLAIVHAAAASRVKRRFITGETVPFLGQQLELFVETDPARRRSRLTMRNQTLDLQVASSTACKAALEKWYRTQALHFFGNVADELAATLGVTVRRISVGNFRSQWGSCSRDGRLTFNWRLLLAPSVIARYVAAHEVAHLRYANHSPQFWQTVRQLHPTADTDKKWLKKNERQLVL